MWKENAIIIIDFAYGALKTVLTINSSPGIAKQPTVSRPPISARTPYAGVSCVHAIVDYLQVTCIGVCCDWAIDLVQYSTAVNMMPNLSDVFVFFVLIHTGKFG